ncbi:SH3 domain-containing protein [Streptomyces sp. E11-3]|uniref:SH3 domain-containing protein n=1 Tax=Streptomyces sp. E11-3 TaxID=3110112 RepID=UPI003980E6A3
MRSGPGTSHPALGLLATGTGVEVKCKAKKAGWMRVHVLNGKLDGRTGRVASRYIRPSWERPGSAAERRASGTGPGAARRTSQGRARMSPWPGWTRMSHAEARGFAES